MEKLYRKVIKKLEKRPVIEKVEEKLNLDTMIEQENGFAKIPNEVKYIIFSKLNVHEIAKVMTVCKEWYEFLQDTLFTKTFPKRFKGNYPGHIIEPVDRTKYCFLYLKVDQFISKNQLPLCIQFGEYDPSFVREIIGSGTDTDLDAYLKYGHKTVDDIHTGFKIKKHAYVSPLHYASACCSYEAIKVLLNHNANVNLRDNSQYTPLMLTCQNGGKNSPQIVNLLVEHGADIHATLNDGRNALDIALSRYNQKVANYLEQKGATSSKNVDFDEIVEDVIDDVIDDAINFFF